MDIHMNHTTTPSAIPHAVSHVHSLWAVAISIMIIYNYLNAHAYY